MSVKNFTMSPCLKLLCLMLSISIISGVHVHHFDMSDKTLESEEIVSNKRIRRDIDPTCDNQKTQFLKEILGSGENKIRIENVVSIYESVYLIIDGHSHLLINSLFDFMYLTIK